MTREQTLAEADDIAMELVRQVGSLNALIFTLGLLIGAPDWYQAKGAWMLVRAVWQA